MNTSDREESVTLEILENIEKNKDISQRDLAKRLGIALGLTNSYLKRCARKGWVKIQQAPANCYFYYLTPKGFAEKSRLTARYFSHSLIFYRKAGEDCRAVFRACQEAGERSVLLCGVSELAEIAFLRAREIDVEIVGVYDPACRQRRFLGYSVWSALPRDHFDVCLLTALQHPQMLYQDLVDRLGTERVRVPKLLGWAT